MEASRKKLIGMHREGGTTRRTRGKELKKEPKTEGLRTRWTGQTRQAI
jgi:hypothetical protein